MRHIYQLLVEVPNRIPNHKDKKTLMNLQLFNKLGSFEDLISYPGIIFSRFEGDEKNFQTSGRVCGTKVMNTSLLIV